MRDPEGIEVQPGDTNIPPMARQPTGVRAQLHEQRRRRQLRARHAVRAGNAEYAPRVVHFSSAAIIALCIDERFVFDRRNDPLPLQSFGISVSECGHTSPLRTEWLPQARRASAVWDCSTNSVVTIRTNSVLFSCKFYKLYDMVLGSDCVASLLQMRLEAQRCNRCNNSNSNNSHTTTRRTYSSSRPRCSNRTDPPSLQTWSSSGE